MFGRHFAIEALVVASFGIAACAPTPSASPATTPTSAASPPPVASSPVAEFHVSLPAGIEGLAWSPDGNHLLLDSGGFEVLDNHGRTVATADGVTATWVDAQHVAIQSAGAPGFIGGPVVVEGLDGSTTAIPGIYQGRGLIGDGAGSLALMPASANGLTAPDRFAVWSNGVLGPSEPGAPLAWFPDGSQLVVTTGEQVRGTLGTPANGPIGVVARPFNGKAKAFTGVRVDAAYVPAFNQDGSEVAFECATVADLAGCHQLVYELGSGQTHDVTAQPPGIPLTWLPNGDLLLAADDAAGLGVLREWNGTRLLQTSLPSASWGLAVPSGAIALVSEAADGTTSTRIIDPRGVPVATTPGTALSWSSDGSSLAIRGDSGNELTLLVMGSR
jgi:hypothetical protein